MSTVLTPDQIDQLRQELALEDLSIYSVVIIARQAVELGRYAEAVSMLRVDADKIRMHSRELYDLINY